MQYDFSWWKTTKGVGFRIKELTVHKKFNRKTGPAIVWTCNGRRNEKRNRSSYKMEINNGEDAESVGRKREFKSMWQSTSRLLNLLRDQSDLFFFHIVVHIDILFNRQTVALWGYVNMFLLNIRKSSKIRCACYWYIIQGTWQLKNLSLYWSIISLTNFNLARFICTSLSSLYNCNIIDFIAKSFTSCIHIIL